MSRRRVSDPPRAGTLHPTSPTATNDRSTRASSIFPYSTARPPTNYSEQSWLPPKDAPPVPPRALSLPESPAYSPYGDGADETPSYARPDWDQERSPATETSAYSRSSFAGMTTAPPTTAFRLNTLGDIQEEEEDRQSDGTRMSGQNGDWGVGGLVASPGAMTATPARSVFGDHHRVKASDAGVVTRRESDYRLGYVNSPGELTPASRGSNGRDSARKSTLPSVLDLEHLTQTRGEDPFADGATHRRPYEQQTPSHNADGFEHNATPLMGQSPKLMSPAAQQRLGRMSVATARYTANRKKQISGLFDDGHTRSDGRDLADLPLKGASGAARFYLTWRIFIAPALCLTAALLVTISLQNNPGTVSRYVSVPSGVFTKSPSGVGEVGLGANGWCPLDRYVR